MFTDGAAASPEKRRPSTSTSPPKPPLPTPPQSPKTPTSHTPWSDRVQYSKNVTTTRYFEAGHEETRTRAKIAGLSSLQQRVLLHHDRTDETATFKSLTDFTSSSDEPHRKPVAKSHSFKSKIGATGRGDLVERRPFDQAGGNADMKKASSLDSVKDVAADKEFGKLPAKDKESSSDSVESGSEYLDSPANSVTISGPSHTAVVNVSGSAQEARRVVVVEGVSRRTLTLNFDSNETSTDQAPDQQVSITKIQLKREPPPAARVASKNAAAAVPEFLNVHLNRVDAKPAANVVLTTTSAAFSQPEAFGSEAVSEGQTRKFSKEDIEIIEKEEEVASPPPARIYKKNAENSQRRSSTENKSGRPSLRVKSNSLDIVESLKRSAENLAESPDRTKHSSATDLQESGATDGGVVLRRKSAAKSKKDEEPELMKVFARRSLKLKDFEEDDPEFADPAPPKSADSDKENQAEPTPAIEIPGKTLVESEVALRKPSMARLFPYAPRAVSLTVPKATSEDKLPGVQNNNSCAERPKTEMGGNIRTWTSSVKMHETTMVIRDEVITEISNKSDFINEDFPTVPKNFSQRKAEWEKRAQEALKKTP